MRGITTLFLSIFFLFIVIMNCHASTQCVECHEEMALDHAASVHRDIPCLECHTQAVEEDHEQVAQVDCRQCHKPHGEKVAHDAHSRVTCKACHVKGGIPAIDPESGNIISSGMFLPGMALPIHQAIPSETNKGCGNCHFAGNSIGAAAMVLPAKSILCMPCHVATFSLSDTTTLVSLFIFLLGMVGLGTVWFSGSIDRKTHWSGKKSDDKARLEPGGIFTAFIKAILLQRLFQRSRVRWAIHALIFFPILFRLAFGLTSLLLSIFLANESITIAMLDKNFAIRALFFDVTGLMILAGAVAAFVRKGKDSDKTIAVLPEPGTGMPVLIGLIVLVGFVLEGLRIAMTGWPDGAGWAFLGNGISLMFKDIPQLTDIYGYVWYVHAILTGAFMALIPFTRMTHIITAPIVLIINARSRAKNSFRKNKI